MQQVFCDFLGFLDFYRFYLVFTRLIEKWLYMTTWTEPRVDSQLDQSNRPMQSGFINTDFFTS